MREDTTHKASLRVYLGYAAGIGKTFKMLEETQQARQLGTDIVIGYFEPHGRQDTIEKSHGIEVVPRKAIRYRGRVFEEMDTEALIKRRPQVSLVDELAHTNVPGSERTKRWEEVVLLLQNGISVWTTVNLQHLESLNDEILRTTGVRVRETVPDWLIRDASELILVDLPPDALLNRLRRGVVYRPELVDRALEGFFREPNLVTLREMALRQAAHEVEVRESPERDRKTREASEGLASDQDRPAESSERILIYVSSHPSTAKLIRRAKRLSDYLHSDCIAVCLETRSIAHLPPARRAPLERHLGFARSLRIDTRVIEGVRDRATALVEFARINQVSQIYISRSEIRTWQALFRRSLVHRLVRLARDLRVTVVHDQGTRSPGRAQDSESLTETVR
ncbi:MAG: histidine kinase [Acidobacteria bacterium]|nr:MAG: histidine kinase [Acidobacteriota bacterium]